MTLLPSNKIKSIFAGLALATMASLVSVVPATAGGSFSLSIESSNSRDGDAVNAAMQLYSLFSGHRNNRSGIRQRGRNNRAGLRQNGRGNQGNIYQEGQGHSGTLQQYGNNNRYGIYQFGRNTNANVVQRGRGQSGATFLFGW